jgi:hypothetical protein
MTKEELMSKMKDADAATKSVLALAFIKANPDDAASVISALTGASLPSAASTTVSGSDNDS